MVAMVVLEKGQRLMVRYLTDLLSLGRTWMGALRVGSEDFSVGICGALTIVGRGFGRRVPAVGTLYKAYLIRVQATPFHHAESNPSWRPFFAGRRTNPARL